jgi:hypothetical protein
MLRSSEKDELSYFSVRERLETHGSNEHLRLRGYSGLDRECSLQESEQRRPLETVCPPYYWVGTGDFRS